ncbi:hypothetical protein FA95DRAFT_1395833 [Auriscalpium vulgare]|uniref:Uncharacterized protein n=1 Tax=Auriscalpium vulgare TaxID=40419 RepID=A0ACB8RQM8_9AGAM|nr:hypothetical protein FA95DRAFT_1395833 [Auriscalpium vulgare]
MEAISSTLNGEKNGRLPRSSGYPNLGIMNRLPDGCGAVGWGDDDGFGAGLQLLKEEEDESDADEQHTANPTRESRIRGLEKLIEAVLPPRWPMQIEGDGLAVGRGSGEANSVIYGSSSALNVPQEGENITEHDVGGSPSWNSAAIPMDTQQLDHPYRSGQQRDHTHEADQQYSEAEPEHYLMHWGGADQGDGHENRKEGGGIMRVGGWRATVWPASPPPSSPPATVFNSASPFNGLEESYR